MNYLSNIIGKRCVEPIIMPASPQISDVTTTGLFPTNAISCLYKSRIALKTTFSANNLTSKARLIFYDQSNNIIGDTDEFIIKNTTIVESGRYRGSLFVFANEMGASSFKIRITSAPTPGNLQMTAGMTA